MSRSACGAKEGARNVAALDESERQLVAFGTYLLPRSKDVAANDHVVHRTIAHRTRRAASGQGIFIRDETGKDYIDASGGGRCRVSALTSRCYRCMRAQLDKLEYAHTSFFTSQAAEELADDLRRTRAEGLSHAFFVSAGPRTIEAALKAARQYFVERGGAAAALLIAPASKLPRRHTGCACSWWPPNGSAGNSHREKQRFLLDVSCPRSSVLCC